MQASPLVQGSSSSQAMPSGAARSVGQSTPVPSQLSSPPHTASASRQTVPAASGAQLPSLGAPAATLQAWQSPSSESPQPASQQTPSTQNPLRHASS